ncbi:MAG TPA: hypothetical protein VHB30_06125 [Solirubrobacteraceae bacterium]|nr:hypothetical protein [Solirubrobacteraceae bacterium]
MRRLALLVVVVVAAIAVAAPAYASSSVQDGYGGNAGRGTSAVTHVAPKAPTKSSSPSSTPTATPTKSVSSSETGSLPFTGLDLALMGLGGLLLLGLGVALRRLTRHVPLS